MLCVMSGSHFFVLLKVLCVLSGSHVFVKTEDAVCIVWFPVLVMLKKGV